MQLGWVLMLVDLCLPLRECNILVSISTIPRDIIGNRKGDYHTMSVLVVQKPRPNDITGIVELVNADSEHLIPRKRSEVRKKLAFWRIIKVNRKVVACGCLEKYSRRMAEVRSFIVHPDYRGRGYGEAILKELLKLALPNQKVFVVTSLPDFFKKYTFSECLQEKYILFYG